MHGSCASPPSAAKLKGRANQKCFCFLLLKVRQLLGKATGGSVMTDSQTGNFHFWSLWSSLIFGSRVCQKDTAKASKCSGGGGGGGRGGGQKPKSDAAAGLHSLQRNGCIPDALEQTLRKCRFSHTASLQRLMQPCG